MNKSFWKNKRVLVTGHTGFKGSWLTLWLHSLGAKVTGVSLEPQTKPSLFNEAKIAELCEHHVCDIRNLDSLRSIIHQVKPEIVFHLAAQALVRESYKDPVGTFSTNLMGSVHLLESFRGLNEVKSVVMVTTDKVYQNKEWLYPYREDDALGGHDPYSASKGASEILIASYRDSFLREQGVSIATARAGNVIGGGDWSLDRLIPDAVKAWQAGETLIIRSPEATRPWQHVLEPVAAYITLAEKIVDDKNLAGAYNFGPASHEAMSVGAVIEKAAPLFKGAKYEMAQNLKQPHEARWLALETSKARHAFNIQPKLNLETSLDWTMNWFQSFYAGSSARELCLIQMAEYEAL